MSTDTTSLDVLDFTPPGLAAHDAAADLLFLDARTAVPFADRELADGPIHSL